MASIEYSVAGQQIAVTKDTELVENTVGVYDVKFTFDSSWSDFTDKTAVFVSDTHPDAPYEVPLDGNGEAPIPAAVIVFGNLMIGVYGSTQTQQYPTIWAPAKRVWPGAGPGMEPPADPVFGMVVRTAPQELTEEQQEIARTNIGAAPEVIPDSTPGNITIIDTNSNIADSGVSLSDIMPTKSASGRVIKIYDGAEGMPLKSAILHINPRKLNSNVIRHGRTILNVRKKVLLTGTDFLNQILRYSSSASVDTVNKYVSLPANSTADAARGGYDGLQYLDEPYTFALTLQKASGTSTANCLRLFYNYNQSNSNFKTLTSPVTTKQAVIHNVDVKALNCLIHTNRGTQATRLYYEESYIVDGEITSMDQVPEYVGEQVVREFPADVEVYAGEFNLLTGELSVCPVIESYNGETLTGEWFSSLDDYAPGTTPTTGAFVVDLAGEKTTYQLEPVILHTLKGYNRIWADFRYYTYSNELEIEYCCDPALAIDEKAKAIKESIAYVQDDFTAVQPYEVNDLVYVGDDLYIVTSAVSQGATMTPNTNISATTLNAVIKSLR